VELEDRVTISTPEGLPIGLQLAGAGSRFIAGGFDFMLELVIIGLVVLLAAALLGGALATAVAAISVFAVIWFYHVLFEVLGGGRSPGKRLVHLRVLRDDGTPVDFGASAIRNLLRIIDIIFLYIPALLFIIFTRRNQRLGDLAAGTLVVREAPKPKRSRKSRAKGAAEPPSPPATAELRLDVSAISDEEVVAVRRFLTRREDLDPDARRRLAHRLASGLGAKVAGAPADTDPERFLEALVTAKTST
jgi:uncharacterized RDD family membrane protein YckC